MHTVVFTGAIVAQVPKTTYQAFTRSCARAALQYRAALNNRVGSIRTVGCREGNLSRRPDSQ